MIPYATAQLARAIYETTVQGRVDFNTLNNELRDYYVKQARAVEEKLAAANLAITNT